MPAYTSIWLYWHGFNIATLHALADVQIRILYYSTYIVWSQMPRSYYGRSEVSSYDLISALFVHALPKDSSWENMGNLTSHFNSFC